MFYTFLLTYKNAACIRQVEAEGIKEAVENWIPLLKDVPFGKEKVVLDLNEVRQELKDARLVPLHNLKNVWCTFVRFGSIDALLNVVATVPIAEESFALV